MEVRKYEGSPTVLPEVLPGSTIVLSYESTFVRKYNVVLSYFRTFVRKYFGRHKGLEYLRRKLAARYREFVGCRAQRRFLVYLWTSPFVLGDMHNLDAGRLLSAMNDALVHLRSVLYITLLKQQSRVGDTLPHPSDLFLSIFSFCFTGTRRICPLTYRMEHNLSLK